MSSIRDKDTVLIGRILQFGFMMEEELAKSFRKTYPTVCIPEETKRPVIDIEDYGNRPDTVFNSKTEGSYFEIDRGFKAEPLKVEPLKAEPLIKRFIGYYGSNGNKSKDLSDTTCRWL